MLAWILVVSKNLTRSIIRSIVLFGIVFVGSAGAFFLGYFVEIFPLVIVSVGVWTITYLRKFMEERQSKNEIRSIFSRYISTEVADELIRHGVESLKLG